MAVWRKGDSPDRPIVVIALDGTHLWGPTADHGVPPANPTLPCRVNAPDGHTLILDGLYRGIRWDEVAVYQLEAPILHDGAVH